MVMLDTKIALCHLIIADTLCLSLQHIQVHRKQPKYHADSGKKNKVAPIQNTNSQEQRPVPCYVLKTGPCLYSFLVFVFWHVNVYVSCVEKTLKKKGVMVCQKWHIFECDVLCLREDINFFFKLFLSTTNKQAKCIFDIHTHFTCVTHIMRYSLM